MGSKPPPAEDAKPTAGERSDTDVEHLTQDDLTVDLLQAEETPAVQERPRFAPAEMPSRSPASSPPPRWSQVWARVARSAESSSEISSVELPVESGTVDHVISNCVINLSPEKPRVFKEIARVLKPGGRMVVSDIVVEDFPDELRGMAALHSACVAGAVSEAEYLEGLEAAGLTEVEVQDRFTYDAMQIAGIVASELDLGEELMSDLGDRSLEQVCESIAGKVHSIRVHARKR